MAMFKDSDITAAMIQEKFPAVAAEIVAGASSQNSGIEITAESIRVSHPDIVAAIESEARANVEASITTAVTAENARIASIQALSQPGYESIITAALADTSVSADQVKIQMFDAINEKRTSTASLHSADGESLGKDLISLGGGSADGGDTNVSDDDKAAAAMAEAGKKARGEM
jgi:hypothetical protein